MALHKEIASVASTRTAEHNNTPALWEISPCATALWNRDRSACLLNESAQRLTNYTEADFLNCRSLWINRIHPNDQQNFSLAQEALRNGKSPVQCDYRFLPRNARTSIWLREISILDTNCGNAPWEIRSVYTDISDLKDDKTGGVKEDNVMDAIKLVSHELMNCVQKIIMELELAKLGLDENLRSTDLVSTVDTMNRSVVSLRDQLARLFESFAAHDPSTILDVTVQKLRKELHRRRVNLRMVRRGPLPMVRGDREQLVSAFERVLEFCGAMLKDGGNLEVQAGPKEVGGELYAEVKVISSSAGGLGSDDTGISESFQKRNGYQIGLGIELAAEILGRYRGQVSFRKEGKNRGEVTILIKASPS